MTITDVAAEVERIREMWHDNEKAHSAEDALHRRVLHSIADGLVVGDVRAVVREALRTLEIDFERWRA